MDDLDGYLPIEDAAERMSLSVAEVRGLCRRRALRAVDFGGGLVIVLPAILSGAVHTH